MINDQIPAKYFLYARKSTESDDRQVQSIDDQIRLMHELANDLGVTIVATFQESRSAKKPGNRPVFDDMLLQIEHGKASGILCWQINRLSRNPIDSGKISWMLQTGSLKVIQTFERRYLPEDNVLMFSVESGMANQYVIDLSKNVRRGIQSKLDKGWLPGVAPTGYINKLDDHTVIPDPERFPLLRKAWDTMLTGQYTVPRILQMLNDEWGFRTMKRRRSGDMPFALSGIYKMFNSPFYKGFICHNGNEYPGKHQAMVTPDEFERVQQLLGRKANYRVRKNNFAFTGLIHCGECGCIITAEVKTKRDRHGEPVRDYTYYHCTRKKVGQPCSQKKVIRVEELERQIIEVLNQITIIPAFRDWALEILRDNQKKEEAERLAIYESQQKAIVSAQSRVDKLIDLRCQNLLTDDEFLVRKKTILSEIADLEQQRDQSKDQSSQKSDTVEQVFNFAVQARDSFMNGSSDTKRGILMSLGQNFTLEREKLAISLHNWLIPLEQRYPALQSQYFALEPRIKRLPNSKSADLDKLILSWHGCQGSNLG